MIKYKYWKYSKKYIHIILTFLTITIIFSLPTHAHGDKNLPDLVRGVVDSVVNISMSEILIGKRAVASPKPQENSPFAKSFEKFFKPKYETYIKSLKVHSLGSGFVIDASGFILTNKHVLKNVDKHNINIILSDGTKIGAKIISNNHRNDIAILKVKTKIPLSAVKFSGSKNLKLGTPVIAIGNPRGMGSRVSHGIVSGFNRNIKSGPLYNYIQTDAVINKGDNGGALFNMHGEVIGIIAGTISRNKGASGVGYAIPSYIALSEISNFITKRK